MKLSILMATYDRWIPYFKSILSVKPLLAKGSEVQLDIRVDSKLNIFLYWIKYLVTDILLYGTQFTIGRGGAYIGATRDMLVKNANGVFFMNLDDDDWIKPEGVRAMLPICNTDSVDIINFDFYPQRYGGFTEFTKWNWLPTYWFGKDKSGLNIGQSSLFRKSLYLSLPEKYQYRRRLLEDMLPNHIMYLEANHIVKYGGSVVVRNRGDKSLTLTVSLLKYCEIVQSLEEFKEYLYSHLNQDTEKIWKIVLTNNIEYQAKYAGVDLYFKLLHGYFQYETLWKERD